MSHVWLPGEGSVVLHMTYHGAAQRDHTFSGRASNRMWLILPKEFSSGLIIAGLREDADTHNRSEGHNSSTGVALQDLRNTVFKDPFA